MYVCMYVCMSRGILDSSRLRFGMGNQTIGIVSVVCSLVVLAQTKG